MPEIRFTVYGRPIPQGSSRGFPIRRANGKLGVAITHDNEKTGPYRQEVAGAALRACAEAETAAPAPRGTPVALSILFVLAKPQSAPKRTAVYPTKKPDCDKLCRSVLDALTGILYEDDSQVTDISAQKVYGIPERTEICASHLNDVIAALEG